MPEIQRPEALYRQVAAAIRKGIASGEYPPGSPLPSEAQLITRYGVSRPTIRNAVATLRSEALIDVVHGKGSFVRRPSAPVLTVERSIRPDDTGAFAQDDTLLWHQIQEPRVHRAETTTTSGALLHLDVGEVLIVVDRVLVDARTATRLIHQTLIPLATAENTELADRPDTEPTRVYALLTDAGHTLSWTETVRARMPLPDERTTLQLQDATPILETIRVTHESQGRPLLLEALQCNAEAVQLTYHIAPASALGLPMNHCRQPHTVGGPPSLE